MAYITKISLLFLIAALACANANDNTTASVDVTTDSMTTEPDATTQSPPVTGQTDTTTTTTITPTPTPTPTAPPAPTPPKPSDPDADAPQGSWNVSDGKRTCLLSKMGIKLSFDYAVDGENTTKNVSFDVPKNASLDKSTCGDKLETLALSFGGWSVSFAFALDSATKKWSVTDLEVDYKFGKGSFPNITTDDVAATMSLKNVSLFSTPNASSYQCVSQVDQTNFVSSLPKQVTALRLRTSDLHVQAFRQANSTDYDNSIPCPADTEVSNIVPIAVGAALAGLVVIVLIAYLIGRKRNKRGYESV